MKLKVAGIASMVSESLDQIINITLATLCLVIWTHSWCCILKAVISAVSSYENHILNNEYAKFISSHPSTHNQLSRWFCPQKMLNLLPFRLSIVDTTCISQSQIETSKGMMGSEATVCTNVDNGNLMCLFLGIQLHMQYGLLAQWLRNHSSFHH